MTIVLIGVATVLVVTAFRSLAGGSPPRRGGAPQEIGTPGEGGGHRGHGGHGGTGHH
jgi:hypothetical protein